MRFLLNPLPCPICGDPKDRLRGVKELARHPQEYEPGEIATVCRSCATLIVLDRSPKGWFWRLPTAEELDENAENAEIAEVFANTNYRAPHDRH